MNINKQIEALCKEIIEYNKLEDGDIMTGIEIIYSEEDYYYKTVFDMCFFREAFVYDIVSTFSLTDNEYANELLDNQCSN